MSPDSFDLKRFISAQEPVIAEALNELRAGHKTGHWMWFVFPQIRGLAEQIFGYPDDVKFRSCMTLFMEAAPEESMYRVALQKYYAGEPDPRSLELLDFMA